MRVPTVCHKCGKGTFHELKNPIEVKDVFEKIQHNFYCQDCINEGWVQQNKKQQTDNLSR
jgi:hypothetical protein